MILLSGCSFIQQEKPAKGEVKIFTCPEECPETIENLLEKADKRVYCELYYLTYEGYIDKIKGLSLLKQNITVKLILEDNKENRNTQLEFQSYKNIEIKMMKKYSIFHPKICLIDDVLFIGSHNWSENSVERNREVNALIYNSEGVNEQYLAIFEKDWNDAFS